MSTFFEPTGHLLSENVAALSEGIFREESGDTLYLAWNNRRLPKDKVLPVLMALAWMIWAPATVAGTVKLINGNGPSLGLVLWMIFGWGGTIWVPYSFLQRLWTEWLVVSPTSISHGFRGFLARGTKTFPLESVRELSVGRFYNVEDNEQESAISLNIHLRQRNFWRNRRMLAYWLAPTIKEEIFRLIAGFVEQHGINLKLERYQ